MFFANKVVYKSFLLLSVERKAVVMALSEIQETRVKKLQLEYE